MKTKDWQELTRLTSGAPLIIERVRLTDSGIAIEGAFDLPPLRPPPRRRPGLRHGFRPRRWLNQRDGTRLRHQLSHRQEPLSRIAGQLQMVETVTTPPNEDVIAVLERGEITAQEAIERLSK